MPPVKLKKVWTEDDILTIKTTLGIPLENNDNYEKFRNVTAEKLLELKVAGFVNPREAQNEGPTIAEFLKFAKKYPNAKFDGYVIFPPRSDIRVTVETISYVGEFANDKSVIRAFGNKFGRADEFSMEPDKLLAWWD